MPMRAPGLPGPPEFKEWRQRSASN